MLEALETAAAHLARLHHGRGTYRGHERRTNPSSFQGLLMSLVDHIDYPVLMVADGMQVLHANRTALSTLDDEHPFQLSGQGFHVRDPRDVTPLREALEGALWRGLRRLMILGRGADDPVWLAIIPLVPATLPCSAFGDSLHRVALLVFGKRRICQALSVQSFARSHGLTMAETAVLEALCDGARPQEVAQRHGVRLCTVRSQINSLRAKTGAASIPALVRQVAVLPPILGLLAGNDAPRAAPGTLRRVAPPTAPNDAFGLAA